MIVPMSHDSTLVQCLEVSDMICGRLEKHEDEMRAAVEDGIRILMQLREASFNPPNSIHSSLESQLHDSMDKSNRLDLCFSSNPSPFAASFRGEEMSVLANKQSFSSAVRGLLMPSSNGNEFNHSLSDLEPPSRISSGSMSVDGDPGPNSENLEAYEPDLLDSSSANSLEVYCICRQASEGDMIACDYEHCATKWFHMKCVNLSRVPNGNWYCRDCRSGKSNRLKKSLL